MSEYNAVPPPVPGAPLPGQAAVGNGAGGAKKDAFADAVQRARQVRQTAKKLACMKADTPETRFIFYIQTLHGECVYSQAHLCRFIHHMSALALTVTEPGQFQRPTKYPV